MVLALLAGSAALAGCTIDVREKTSSGAAGAPRGSSTGAAGSSFTVYEPPGTAGSSSATAPAAGGRPAQGPGPHDDHLGRVSDDDDIEDERDKTDMLGPGRLADHCTAEPPSCCGFPGDVGNELGVGKYCVEQADCAGNGAAVACSSFENGETDHKSFFCTFPCEPNGPADQCGTGALCRCEPPFGCGCEPAVCSENPLPGCEGG